ncbi:[similarity to] integrase family protein [methanotrophic bacterial endosymbiont of Bathymodiolus sp.]|nr:[similarity to] integrase family protein [methanotrophic bacterial endosymbiont of Bathymodiolus sp.]
MEEIRLHEIIDREDLKKKLKETPDYLHMAGDTALELLKGVSIKNTACSERTGDFINFTASRFRYTKGTNLARRGISGVALAAALDHTDTQNIGVYTENTEETAQQIDEIMAPILAPLAQAFAGKLITTEREALRANDPNSRIKNGKSNNVGNCGTYAFCASGYRACYTCTSFQPWLEAPHKEVLEEIIAERRRQEESGVSLKVIQSTDRLLLSVQQVIFLCKERILEEDVINV